MLGIKKSYFIIIMVLFFGAQVAIFMHCILWFLWADIMTWDPRMVVFIDVPIIFVISLLALCNSLYNAVVDYTTDQLDERLKELKS